MTVTGLVEPNTQKGLLVERINVRRALTQEGSEFGRAEGFFRAVVGIPAERPRRLPSGRLKLPVGSHDPETYPVAGIDEAEQQDNGPFFDEPFDDGPIFGDLGFPIDGEAVQRGIGEEGLEFLAVYAPFTSWGRDWGIYFFANRIYEFAATLVREEPRLGRDRRDLLDGLMTMLQEHEEFHFRVELASIHHRAASGFDHYGLYSSRYSFSALGSDAAEEAIATALELAEGRQGWPEVARAVARRTASMPKGYSEHAKYRGESGQQRGLSLIASRILDRPDRTRVPADLMQPDFASLYLASVPRYWLVERPLPPWVKDYLVGRRDRPLTLTDILRHARKNATVLEGKGRHPLKVARGGRVVPLQDHPRVNRAYPDHIVGQLAHLFEMPRVQYVQAVLSS